MDCGFESPLLPIGIHNAKKLIQTNEFYEYRYNLFVTFF